ncbi:MAG: hypothetical protein WC397_03055 [Candidatus Paceibacterota bacterium]
MHIRYQKFKIVVKRIYNRPPSAASFGRLRHRLNADRGQKLKNEGDRYNGLIGAAEPSIVRDGGRVLTYLAAASALKSEGLARSNKLISAEIITKKPLLGKDWTGLRGIRPPFTILRRRLASLAIQKYAQATPVHILDRGER